MFPKKYTNQVAVTDITEEKQFEAIGRLVAEWGLVELIIDSTIHSLMKVNYRLGLCVTTQVAGPARKFDALFSLARLTRGESSVDKNWRSLREEALRLAEKRNRVVHDYWVASPTGTPQRFEMTARGRLKAEWIEVPITELLSITSEIKNFSSRLELKAEALRNLPTVPDPDDA